MDDLTPRQRQVLKFIQEAVLEHGMPPTRAEIAEALGFKSANAAGTLPLPLRATYFTSPRPVYELYDLSADPSELNNLSGKPELASIERELRLALTEKMILDFDYLPLPALLADNNTADATPPQKAKKNKAGKNK